MSARIDEAREILGRQEQRGDQERERGWSVASPAVRLDAFMSDAFEMSKAQARRHIEQEGVRVNGNLLSSCATNTMVRHGDVVTLGARRQATVGAAERNVMDGLSGGTTYRVPGA